MPTGSDIMIDMKVVLSLHGISLKKKKNPHNFNEFEIKGQKSQSKSPQKYIHCEKVVELQHKWWQNCMTTTDDEDTIWRIKHGIQ